MIDLDRGVERPTRAAIADLLERTEPTHSLLGIAPYVAQASRMLDTGNGAMRQRAVLAEVGGDLRALHAQTVERTRRSAEEVHATLGLVTVR